jgi:hypothetical protein
MLKRWAAWPQGARWLVCGIAAVVLAVAVAWFLFVPAADWLARHDVGSPKGAPLQTARDAARGRLLTLGAGLFAASALLFTARNFILSREGQVTDRYTKAIEQLGQPGLDKLHVRIGGIYALERVARDSKKDHLAVMEVLTAFIRQYSHEQWPPPGDDGEAQERWTRPDVQAAVTVVGRRDVKQDLGQDIESDIKVWPIDLYEANLTKANLTRANLRGVGLRSANLTGAFLQGTILDRANLRYATFHGAHIRETTFDGADLTQAQWPRDAEAPEGWKLDTASGGLQREGTDSKPAGAN